MYCKEKWCTADGKDPLLGRVDGFQIDPKIFRKDFNQEIVSKYIRRSFHTGAAPTLKTPCLRLLKAEGL